MFDVWDRQDWESNYYPSVRSYAPVSDRFHRMDGEFYRSPKRTVALEAAVRAFNQFVDRDKTLGTMTPSDKIIPFESLLERKRSMNAAPETKKELEVKSPAPAQESQMSNPFSSLANFEAAQRMATALSKSTMVPKEYQNNVPNCLIALELAQRLKGSVLMVMQNLYIVHGRPGWSSQYIIAAINSSGRFNTLDFEFSDDNQACRAFAKDLRTGETRYGTNITLDMAKQEGWSTRSGSKWITMPEQMLRYRAASFFGKAYCPEILMGFQTAEELEDMRFDVAKEVKSEVAKPIVKQIVEKPLANEVSFSESKPVPAEIVIPEQELPWDKYLDPQMVK